MNRWQEFGKYHKENPCLRLGQAFCNFFQVWPGKLFYTTDEELAMSIIRQLNTDLQWGLDFGRCDTPCEPTESHQGSLGQP